MYLLFVTEACDGVFLSESWSARLFMACLAVFKTHGVTMPDRHAAMLEKKVTKTAQAVNLRCWMLVDGCLEQNKSALVML